MRDGTVYSIGEVAARKQVTIKALRYYHKVGILVPEYVNPENGYRYYTAAQLLHVDIIKVARACNATIKELQTLFQNGDAEVLQTFLQKKQRELKAQIQSLQDVTRVIGSLSEAIRDSEEAVSRLEVCEVRFDERFMVIETLGEPLGMDEVESYAAFDEVVNYDTLDDQLETLGVLPTYRIGYVLRYLDQWRYTGVFHQAKLRTTKQRKGLSSVPAGVYWTVTFEENQEEEALHLLKKRAAAKGSQLQEVYEFVLLTDLFNPHRYVGQYQALLR